VLLDLPRGRLDLMMIGHVGGDGQRLGAEGFDLALSRVQALVVTTTTSGLWFGLIACSFPGGVPGQTTTRRPE
jgi:hypothetical protein